MYTFIINKEYNKVISVFQPIVIGVVLAYLINPLMMLFERLFKKLFLKKVKKPEKFKSLNRGVSIALAAILFISAISLLLYLIIPQIIISITDFVQSAPQKIETFTNWYNQLAKDYDFVGVFNSVNEWLAENYDGGFEFSFESIFGWLTNSLFKVSGLLGNGLISFFGTTFNVAFNMILGFVVSIYILSSKERIFAHFKKLMYAYMNKEKVDDLLDTAREGNKITTRFILGKLIDSLIVGIMCFIVLLIFDMPYPVLVSFIIGVTDIIPFFGPYLGAIPCTLLILLVDPIKAIYFVIIIIVIQQVEGNIISPKILGDTVGLSPFWVLFAMIVGGGLFGLAGMLLAVPVMAILFFIFRKSTERRLKAKNLPIDSTAYFSNEIAEVEDTNDSE